MIAAATKTDIEGAEVAPGEVIIDRVTAATTGNGMVALDGAPALGFLRSCIITMRWRFSDIRLPTQAGWGQRHYVNIRRSRMVSAEKCCFATVYGRMPTKFRMPDAARYLYHA